MQRVKRSQSVSRQRLDVSACGSPRSRDLRGYDLSNLRARQIQVEDFETFDLVLVMDWDNLALVQLECPAEHQHKVRRFSEFCLQFDSPVVPDPYYCGKDGFEHVLDLVEDASEGLLRHVRAQLN
jgi:protein-tyrosine phosphatase